MARLRLVHDSGQEPRRPDDAPSVTAPLDLPGEGGEGSRPEQFFDPELARMADTAARLFAIVRRIRNHKEGT